MMPLFRKPGDQGSEVRLYPIQPEEPHSPGRGFLVWPLAGALTFDAIILLAIGPFWVVSQVATAIVWISLGSIFWLAPAAHLPPFVAALWLLVRERTRAPVLLCIVSILTGGFWLTGVVLEVFSSS